MAAAPRKKQQAPVDPLLLRARQLARGDVNATAAAIMAQQKLYEEQARQQAAQILAAAQGAGQFLGGLGDQTAASYSNAGKTLAGFAQGYSGDLRNTAQTEVDAQAAELAKLAAPAGGLKTSVGGTPQPQALGNALYGLAGDLPAQSFVKQGEAQAGAARTLPAQFLGFGQSQAAGALGAGRDKAAGLTPALLEARSKLPSLTNDYYSTFVNARDKERRFNLDVAKYRTGVDEFNTRQSSLDAYRAASLDMRRAGLQLQYDKLNTAVQNGQKPNASLSRVYGHVVDSFGQDVLGPDGKLIPITVTRGKKPYTAEQIATYQGLLQEGLDTLPDNAGYLDFVKQAVSHKVPWALAVQRANQHWEVTQRPTPQAISQAIGISKKNAADAVHWDQVTADYKQTTGQFGKVTVAPGANRPGVDLAPKVTTFVAALAGLARTPLTIGTGSNHNEHTVNGRISDHWDGHAADIPATGATLTRLGQDALILAGMDPAEARKVKGGLFNLQTPFGRVQVIFNTREGGNHFNHLHVGVR